MKKLIISLVTLATALFAVSCQKESAEGNAPAGEVSDLVEASLTASFEGTKVTYTETSDYDLQPQWEVGDKVIGLSEGDYADKVYTLSVSSVNNDVAVLTGRVPADCKLHLIYCAGVETGDVDMQTKSLPISYSDQNGDKSMPAVALADGEVKNGTGGFVFSNAGAIVGISSVKGVASGSVITNVTVYGENLSTAAVSVENNVLELTAATVPEDEIGVNIPNEITVTDCDGSLSSPILISVPAGAVIKKVSVTADSNVYSYTPESPKNVVAAQYLYIKVQSFLPESQQEMNFIDLGVVLDGKKILFGDRNLGAQVPEEDGKYYMWGDTKGYFWNGISFDGIPEGGFCWKNCPFNNGHEEFDVQSFYSYEGIGFSGATLLPEYDAATVANSEWRMPVRDEWLALIEQTYFAWTFNYNGTGVAGGIFTNKSDPSKKVFFPASGSGFELIRGYRGEAAQYRSSYLDPTAQGNLLQCDAALNFFPREYMDDSNIYLEVYPHIRFMGLPVRPIKVTRNSATEQNLPEGALSGLFSVSADKQIHFSKGNLQFKAGDGTTANPEWRFAEHQYDYIGNAAGNTTTTGRDVQAAWIDLFGWGATGKNPYSQPPYSISTNYSDFSVEYCGYGSLQLTHGNGGDWGVCIGDGGTWYTPSSEEWGYLLSSGIFANDTRDGLYAYGVTVMDKVNCLVIYPDGYGRSKVVSNGDTSSYDTEAEWIAAENAGVVCFPAAGIRDIFSVSNSTAGTLGHYWASDNYSTYGADFMYFFSNEAGVEANYNRSYGYSVRLVTEAK